MAYVTHSPRGIWYTQHTWIWYRRYYGVRYSMRYFSDYPPLARTTEKRLDLTDYMSYNDAEGRRPWWPTALSII
jgi:hypothetical protein